MKLWRKLAKKTENEHGIVIRNGKTIRQFTSQQRRGNYVNPLLKSLFARAGIITEVATTTVAEDEVLIPEVVQ